jgi:FkbM family methyltransferase
MLRGAPWEGGLNWLLQKLIQSDKGHSKLPVVDIGANLGAFSLFAASLECNVWSYEMQPMIYTMLEMSKSINGYHHMKVFNAALWNESNIEISFTPNRGNFGSTSLISNSGTKGAVVMRTQRFDELFRHQNIFFLKIDAENSEEFILRGMDKILQQRKVRHIFMEFRANQAHVIDWFYDMGYKCANFPNYKSSQLWKTKLDAVAFVSSLKMHSDIYCTSVFQTNSLFTWPSIL